MVTLYYWDERDGPALSGWWFGDRPGGERVWSRCPTHDSLPPQHGWRVPYDSKDTPRILLVQQRCPVLEEMTPTRTTRPVLSASKDASGEVPPAEESGRVCTVVRSLRTSKREHLGKAHQRPSQRRKSEQWFKSLSARVVKKCAAKRKTD